MAQEAIAAGSNYWNDKKIELTENTKKNIEKKAYMLDAETMFAQYKLEGDDAVNAAKQNNITVEQLVANPQTYSYLAASAIHDLEENTSKESRVNAVKSLEKIGYTNLYENITRNFLTPPSAEEVPKEEKPKEKPPEPEEESRYQYLRRSYPAQPIEQPPMEQPAEQPAQMPGPSPIASLRGAARFIPDTVRNNLQMKGSSMRPAQVARSSFVQVNPRLVPQRQTIQRPAPTQPQPNEPANQPVQSRPLMNRDAVARLGGAKMNIQPAVKRPLMGNPQRVKVSPKFGLSVRRER